MAKERKHRGMPLVVLLFLIVFAALCIIIYVRPVVQDVLTKTEVISYGSMQITDEVECYFVRDETVVYAGESGTPQYYFEQGERVRKGSRIMDIVPGGGSYTAASSGCLLSYYGDGLEAQFSPANLDTLQPLPEDAEGQEAQPEMEDYRRGSVAQGDAVYKLVRADVWYAVAWVDAQDITKYNKGAGITLQLPHGSVKGSIYDIQSAAEGWKIILKFTRTDPENYMLRRAAATVVTADHSGLMVRNISITAQDGQAGVFVKQISGEFSFTPVKVIYSDGEYSLVEASYYDQKTEEGSERIYTVDAYDEILTDARQQ